MKLPEFYVLCGWIALTNAADKAFLVAAGIVFMIIGAIAFIADNKPRGDDPK